MIHTTIKRNEYQGEYLLKENHQYDGTVNNTDIIAPIRMYIREYYHIKGNKKRMGLAHSFYYLSVNSMEANTDTIRTAVATDCWVNFNDFDI